MQNHLMMMFALLGMDYSKVGEASESDLRKQVFDSMTPLTMENIELLGQYWTYPDHLERDLENSGREHIEEDMEYDQMTFANVSIPLHESAYLFSNVPVYFVSGKALAERRSYTEVVFENDQRLVFNLQGPGEYGLAGSYVLATSSLTTFSMPQNWKMSTTPEGHKVAHAPETPFAYEVLLRAGLEGEKEHFVLLTEVLSAWRVWDTAVKYVDKVADIVDEIDWVGYKTGTEVEKLPGLLDPDNWPDLGDGDDTEEHEEDPYVHEKDEL
mmetsp:Transcript_11629/g.25212  ORF Transcript_11629/g.25212 Transcript_11629/m.25212 type:complete len:269 (-) Transcript_11629:132-938(-)